MERDSFTFRKSWTKALRNLPVEARVEVLSAVLTYADTGETVEMGDMARAAFLFIKTDIDVEVEARAELSRKRAEAVRRRWERRAAAATGGTGDAKRAGDTSDANDTNNTNDTNDTSNTSDTNVSFVSSAASEKERTKERETNADDVEVREEKKTTQRTSSPEKEKEKAVCKHTERESEKEAPKARKVFKPPTVEEVCGFAIETGASHADPEEFHNFYTSNGWKVGRNPMKDWRAAFRRWEREHKRRDEAEERRWNEKKNRTGDGNGKANAGPLWSPTDDQRKHPERYYQSTF